MPFFYGLREAQNIGGLQENQINSPQPLLKWVRAIIMRDLIKVPYLPSPAKIVFWCSPPFPHISMFLLCIRGRASMNELRRRGSS